MFIDFEKEFWIRLAGARSQNMAIVVSWRLYFLHRSISLLTDFNLFAESQLMSLLLTTNYRQSS